MSISPCPNRFEGCPDPFADQHHLYRLSEADTTLKQVYANLGCNVIQLCRCVHEELEATVGWLPFPSDGVMIDTINQLRDAGELTISKTKERKIRGTPA